MWLALTLAASNMACISSEVTPLLVDGCELLLASLLVLSEGALLLSAMMPRR
jgi:hypothetical protein